MDNVAVREMDNLWSETMASINSQFAVMTEADKILHTFLECVVLSPSLYLFNLGGGRGGDIII